MLCAAISALKMLGGKNGILSRVEISGEDEYCTIDDDFSRLPVDILYNIVEFAYFKAIRGDSSPFANLQEVESLRPTTQKFYFVTLSQSTISMSKCRNCRYMTVEDVLNCKGCFISSSHLTNTDYDAFLPIVSRIYESLTVLFLGANAWNFLDKLATRFTSIEWMLWEVTDAAAEFKFFNRHLRSPYLRKFHSQSPTLAQADFAPLLLEFVKKPDFQSLQVGVLMPAEVFIAAFESSRDDSDDLEESSKWKIVSGMITYDELKKVTFLENADNSRVRHSRHNTNTWPLLTVRFGWKDSDSD